MPYVFEVCTGGKSNCGKTTLFNEITGSTIFASLGFGDWKSAVALLTGFVVKEAVVSTMSILHGVVDATEGSTDLITAIQASFTPLTAYAFMAFSLLYLPCMAAFATIKREMNSWEQFNACEKVIVAVETVHKVRASAIVLNNSITSRVCM